MLEEILDDLSEGILPDRDQLRRDILNSAACRSALKAGDPMTEEELKAFVAATLTMDNTRAHAHMVEMRDGVSRSTKLTLCLTGFKEWKKNPPFWAPLCRWYLSS